MAASIDMLRGLSDPKPVHWPFIALFSVSPFLALWAAVRLIRSFSETTRKPKVETVHDKFYLASSSRLEDQLASMNKVIDTQVTRAAAKARRFEILGQLATVLSIGMPFSTWLYAFSQVDVKTKLEHLWPFIFSSTSFGFVAVTVAVTFLRHSKAHAAELQKLRAYSDSLHKVQVALRTESPKDASSTLDLLAKYARFGGGSTPEEAQPQSSEEMKNAFSLVSSLLAKS